MVIRKQVTKGIRTAVPLLIAGIFLLENKAVALGGMHEDTVNIGNLGLRVVFKSSFEQSQPSAMRWRVEICNNFFKQLTVDQGPWGFGLFQTKAGCEGSRQETQALRDPLVWTLSISLNEQKQGVVALCRPYVGESEKCEASVTIPSSQYLPELLKNDSFTRLLAAALLDQSPLRSKLTSQLVSSDDLIVPKDESLQKSEFPLPPLPSETLLLPVVAEIQTSNSKFRVELRRDSPSVMLSQTNIWLVSTVRGAMGQTLSTLISNATATLGSRFQEMSRLDAKARTIDERNGRRKAKAHRPFMSRVESIVETRIGGTFRNSRDNALTADVELLLTEDVLKNLWLGINSVFGNYRYKIESNFNVSDPATDRQASRTLLLATMGAGARWSSESDHTVFFYPRLEFGRVTWKADRLSEESPTLERDTRFVGQFAYGAGLSFGYQSPERWPVQWQAKFAATGLNQKQHRSISGDLSAYVPSPIVISPLRSDIFAFVSYRVTNLALSDNVLSLVKNTAITVSDLFVGGGFRLLWL